jgi:hypothetical protein
MIKRVEGVEGVKPTRASTGALIATYRPAR